MTTTRCSAASTRSWHNESPRPKAGGPFCVYMAIFITMYPSMIRISGVRVRRRELHQNGRAALAAFLFWRDKSRRRTCERRWCPVGTVQRCLSRQASPCCPHQNQGFGPQGRTPDFFCRKKQARIHPFRVRYAPFLYFQPTLNAQGPDPADIPKPGQPR